VLTQNICKPTFSNSHVTLRSLAVIFTTECIQLNIGSDYPSNTQTEVFPVWGLTKAMCNLFVGAAGGGVHIFAPHCFNATAAIILPQLPTVI